METTVLNFIRRHAGKVARVDIAERLNMRFATVSGVVRELISTGLVVEGNSIESSRGRKATSLDINPRARLAVGIDIGTESIRAGVVDLKGKIVRNTKAPSRGARGREAVLAAFSSVLNDLLDNMGASRARVLGIGVADPGIVKSAAGLSVYASNIPGWENFQIEEQARRTSGLPVLVNEGSKLKAIAEHRYGAGRGARNMLYIDIGVGIGSGIVLQNELYAGTDEVAGELGHTRVGADGPLCHCGARGCLEAVAGGEAIAARAREALKQGVRTVLKDRKTVEAKDVFQAAEAGDRMCATLVKECAEKIGTSLANFVTLFNPELVIIGGAIAENSPGLVNSIRTEIKNRAFRYATEHLRFAVSELRENAATIGAANLFIEKFFAGGSINGSG